MKRLLALLLAIVTVLAVCGCSQKAQPTDAAEKSDLEGKFCAGFASVDLTPTQSVPLAGFSNDKFRYCNEIESKVMATTVAFCDEQGTTLIFMSLDVVKVYDDFADQVREGISKATGVPTDCIMLAASHSHSAVTYQATFDAYISEVYYPWMVEQCIANAKAAYDDMAPATLYKGQIEARGLNFVRHYLTTDPITGETTAFGDQHGTPVFNSTTVHASEADPTMYLLKFTREGHRDIVLCNWRGHPHFTDGYTAYKLSADYIGTFRYDLENQMDCDVLFFQGAAGNMNTTSRIKAENKTTELHAFSKLLTDYAVTCLKENMAEVTTHTIQKSYTDYECVVDHSQDYLLPIATEVAQVWNTTGDRDAAMAVADGRLYSPYHANAICWRSKQTENEHLQLYAFAVGDDLAFTVAPNEMFDTNAVWLEEHSPYETNLFLGYANEQRIYIPSTEAFEYGCYEVDITHGKRGTAEEVEENFLRMLREFKS